MEKLYRELKDRGFVLLAVNMREPKNIVRGWVEKERVTYPILLDRNGKVAASYQVYGTPTIFLLDRAGRLVGYAVGPRGWTAEKGRALLAALLALGK